ncbi:MAG: 50S ribosomal protein L6 [Candidatus Roizmanbacteria bacterium]|nr:50S ribosomal protein L6 [Candidatus Roizmanbacteria bacterium]
MSKIGQKTIPVPEGVTVTIDSSGREITIVGPKGTMSHVLPRKLAIELQDQVLTVQTKAESSDVGALHGLYRSIVANAVSGVVTPWKKTLEIHGVGFRAAMQGTDLTLKLGFSHVVTFPTPSEITIESKGNKITIGGCDKQKVGEVAAKIRSIKTPDKYKGKGLRYHDEIVRLKPGKKAKAA